MKDSSRLHDDWRALIFALNGLVTLVNFARHCLNGLLDLLYGTALSRAAHVGNFLPQVTGVFGQLVSQAAKLKSDDPADSAEEGKCQNCDKDDR